MDVSFNSRTSCEVRLAARGSTWPYAGVSTHAPLARCDPRRWPECAKMNVFQLTHLLRGATRRLGYLHPVGNSFNSRTSCEVRLRRQRRATTSVMFQLTHLLRGATYKSSDAYKRNPVSTHAPLARCDRVGGVVCFHGGVSTHAPLARCDAASTASPPVPTTFQLTHLLRGATDTLYNAALAQMVSTHAPLARCDKIIPTEAAGKFRFNSRTSCEVRHLVGVLGGRSLHVSTHAPLARCDGHPVRAGRRYLSFNSRTSCEVRRHEHRKRWIRPVSTHAPLARCDGFRRRLELGDGGFNSRTSCEVRPGATRPTAGR